MFISVQTIVLIDTCENKETHVTIKNTYENKETPAIKSSSKNKETPVRIKKHL